MYKKLMLGFFLAGCVAPAHAADRPRDYVTICKTGQTCSVTSPTNVAFGASNKFVYKVLNGNFACSVTTFGADPIPSKTRKECSIPKNGTGVSSSSSSSSSSSPILSSSSISSVQSSSNSSSSSSTPTGVIEFTKSGGWFETAFVEWKPVANATDYKVYTKLKSDPNSAYEAVDKELVRNNRVDVLGLVGNTEYTVKIVALNESTVLSEKTFNVTPAAHDRVGFAFSEDSPWEVTTGGYNADGSIHPDARILYLTDANKDTIALDVVVDSKGKVETAVGLARISALREKGYDDEPLIIRVLGTVTSPSGLPDPNTYNLWKSKRTNNVTIEGVGEDARISGWGIEIREANNIEVRNLGFGEQPDDGVSIQTKNRNIWIHHNDFYWGKDMGGDKSKGDGSVDMKADSSFITVAYNAFHDTGKGMATGFKDAEQYYITVHHNFFNASDSRHPRVSFGTIHVYNNYYYDIATYGVAAATASHVFVENNYFEGVKRPMFISSQGHDLHGDTPFLTNHTESVWIDNTLGYRSNATGVVFAGNPSVSITSRNDGGAIKQEGNYMDAYSAAWFYEPLDTGNGGRGPVARPATEWVYSEFDTSPIMYEYTAQTAVEAKETVLDLAGRLGSDNRAAKLPQTNL